MKRTLYAVQEAEPGPCWLSFLRRSESSYRQWFLREGDAARPTYLAASAALRQHMPELVPTYERLVDLAGGGDGIARLLALWCPTPYLTGCSQAVLKRQTPLLVRNYDYHPRLWDGLLLRSEWTGTPIVAMIDSLWGVLDGINEHGLAVSLAFGGRQKVGEGFGMPLILRYILETCRSTTEAATVLRRVPSHMSYNVTVLDAAGEHRTVFVSPDRPTVVTRRALATNHQRIVEWAAYANATATLDRERFLRARLEDPAETEARFVQRFLAPPLHISNYHHGWGTLYTAVYSPEEAAVGLYWTGATLHQSITNFSEAAVALNFAEPSHERMPV